ncbi:class C sortase [Bifidobacterium sp. 64T4]|uniref:class C sortase n=1 Tax=Bifidobacterium pongonis TaxID=2834432 RepID=UPI001C56C10B|nr:class C sortase [Bifidobacterium pongonis]MBW3094722.1 class C sortase [Bifidobacterium pongonis]
MTKQRKTGRGGLSGRALAGVALLVLSALFCTLPFMLMVGNSGKTAGITQAHDDRTAALTKRKLAAELRQARDYNTNLFNNGQATMGEVVDPFSNGGSASEADKDEDYQKQLNLPADGIMATVTYPRLGINLPIRHGTSQRTLASGAGHMYGTSLPVGGENTHAVISAHTGLADRLMFDKLSLRQGKIGDFFYIKVAGETLAYKVTSITVVDPDQFDDLKIVRGKDLVTLLTCTPYGVNTQRLLVTGTRTTMPHPAPLPKNAPKDRTSDYMMLYVAIVWVLVVAFIAGYVRKRHRKARPTVSWAKHAVQRR